MHLGLMGHTSTTQGIVDGREVEIGRHRGIVLVRRCRAAGDAIGIRCVHGR